MRGNVLIADDEKQKLILLRPYQLSDKHYILSTWLRNLYRYNSFYQLFDQTSYYTHYNLILNRLLEIPTTSTTIACLRDDPDTILGYSVSTPKEQTTTLHFCFVRGRWRGLNLMYDLLPKNITAFTHLTETGEKIWKQKYTNLKFNPFDL